LRWAINESGQRSNDGAVGREITKPQGVPFRSTATSDLVAAIRAQVEPFGCIDLETEDR
jgi:hypothetical protein